MFAVQFCHNYGRGGDSCNNFYEKLSYEIDINVTSNGFFISFITAYILMSLIYIFLTNKKSK